MLPRLLSHDPDYNVAFDWKVFAFTAAVTLATGVLFGLAPAWASTRAEIGCALNDGGNTATRRRRHWSGKSIVAFQVALSTLLVAAAALFVRTVVNLNSVDLGFQPDHLVLFDVNVPSLRYPAPKDVALLQRLEDTIRAVPGVESVSFSDTALIANSSSSTGFWKEAEATTNGEENYDSHKASYVNVGQDFLRTMHIPLLTGRDFTPADANAPRHVAIINQTAASKYFPGQNPVGKRFSTARDKEGKQREWIDIIGVCGNTRYSDLKHATPPLHFDLFTQQEGITGGSYIIRTYLAPEALVPSLRTAVARIDNNLPLLQVRTQQEQIRETMQTEIMFSALAGGFGLMALALACVGIYGIMAYTVAQRRNEIGIRLALGAARRQIGGMVLREAGWLTLLGVAGGLGAALALGRLVSEMLYGLAPYDAVSLGAASALLTTVALLAALLPAVRAARVEPMEALRHD